MTNKELVEQALQMAGYGGAIEKQSGGITFYKDRWGYVLGGQGELYTQALAKSRGNAKRAGKTSSYFLTSAKQWYSPSRRVVDCSGLIVEAMRTEKPGYGDRTANTFKAQFATCGPISAIPETAGIAVWKEGHIGLYLGGGKVCESRGVTYGVVLSDLKTQKWTHYGKLRDVEYDDSFVVFPECDKPVFRHELEYVPTNMMRGEDVKALQKLLISRGFSCGITGSDGIFGAKTKAAVVAFQTKYKLNVDGIAGKQTVTALGGIFII